VFQYFDQSSNWLDDGYQLISITGYQNGSGADFGAFWAK
jgi:hypothetical protein